MSRIIIKTGLLHMLKKRQRSASFVFVTRIVKSIYSKFQSYSHLLWLRSPVCVGPSRKPQRLVFLTMRLIARYVSDLVGNPKDRFSHNEAHIERF